MKIIIGSTIIILDHETQAQAAQFLQDGLDQDYQKEFEALDTDGAQFLPKECPPGVVAKFPVGHDYGTCILWAVRARQEYDEEEWNV